LTELFDLLLKNGHIIDGTGNPYYRADIAIAEGKIVHIALDIDPLNAKRVIRADGLTVCPGFIDSHTHDDLFVAAKPTADEKTLQGITTLVVGNCGYSVAPILKKQEAFFRSFLGVFGGKDVSDDFLGISTMKDYLERIEAARPGINVLSMVGHFNIRAGVLGLKNRTSTNVELEKMKTLVAQSMEDGAYGLSTGLAYVPGSYTETTEIIELCKVVRQYGGIYTTHLRSESDSVIPAVAEAIRIGAEAGIPVQISHHKVIGKDNWGKSVETLKMMAEARALGVQVTCDQYPYNAGSTFLSAVLPPRYLSEGQEEMFRKLTYQEFRQKVIEEIESGVEGKWENFIRGTGFKNIVISVSPSHHEYIGKSVAEIARIKNMNPYDVIFDLLIDDKASTIVILFMMDDEDIIRIMKNPFTMIGTDGIPSFGNSKVHPRMTGTYPKILGRCVREHGTLSLEDAIRKMTSLPAQTFRIKRKGLLVKGWDADIVVFDPKTIIDRSTYEEPEKAPQGIHYVLVNGQIAVENGKVMGATSGRVLRHRKYQYTY
jgi:N-acyl-D-amino-acid deacylase